MLRATSNILRKKNKNYVLSKEFKNILTNNGTDKNNPQAILKNIRKFSSKYADCIKEIIDHPNENCFVYCKMVEGSGAILFGCLLSLFNFERSRGYEKFDDETHSFVDVIDEEIDDSGNILEREHQVAITKKRYSYVTSITTTPPELARVLNIYNNPLNNTGKYLQVIIGSHLIGEGVSLKNVRQIHILTPHWNNSETEQAIGRGIRFRSHNSLPPDQRYVKIFRHASVPKSGFKSLDLVMYKLSEDKDYLMKQIERQAKISAVDCALNIKRNLRLETPERLAEGLPSDIDYSRDCDYTTCKYKCEFVPEISDDPELITDTYKLYYADDEIKVLTTLIKQLFRDRFFLRSYRIIRKISTYIIYGYH